MTTYSRAPIDPNHHKGLVAIDDVTGDPFAIQGDAATGAINISGTITAASDGAIVDGVSSSIKATVKDLTNSNPLATQIMDANGDAITSFGGGTQYTEDAAAAANPVGTALNLVRDDARGGSLTSTDGDNVAARGTNAGELYVKHVDTIPVTQSGTWNVTNVSGTVSLPTGAATSALQTTGNTSLATIAGSVSGTEMQVDIVSAPTLTVDTELTTADLDTGAGTDTRAVVGTVLAASGGGTLLKDDASFGEDVTSGIASVAFRLWDGAAYDRAPGNSTDGLLVNLGANNDVTVSSSALPTGAATAANQSTIIGHVDGIESLLGTIDTDTGNIATSTATIAGAVSGTEMQVDVVAALPAGNNNIGDVDVASIAAGSNLIGNVGLSGTRTTGGTTPYKNLDVDESEDEVKGSAGQVYWIHAINTTAAPLYLKFYNDTAANVTVGTTTPTLTFPVPGNADSDGAGFTLSIPNGVAFSSAITIAATTGVADNDTGAPGANALVVNLGYA